MIHGKLKLSVLSRLTAVQDVLRAGFQKVPLKTILILQFAVVLCVGAQEPVGEIDLSQPLTLEQCIQIGLEKSTSMRNARLNLAMQELRVKNARAGYFPQIFTNGAYDFSDRVDFGFEPENYNLGLRGQYTLWDNGQREGSFAQAKENLTATVSRNERTKQDLILDITVAYYDVLKRQELVKVSEQVLARSQENTQRTRDFEAQASYPGRYRNC